jgi:hypothetical protein
MSEEFKFKIDKVSQKEIIKDKAFSLGLTITISSGEVDRCFIKRANCCFIGHGWLSWDNTSSPKWEDQSIQEITEKKFMKMKKIPSD